MNLPCMRDKCIGRECANFGDKGCKGGEHPPWSWSKWYLEELPKIKLKVWNETNQRVCKSGRKDDETWNRIWQQVKNEYSQKEKNNESK